MRGGRRLSGRNLISILFFKLSHQAPVDGCRAFNSLLSKHPGKPKIKEKEGLFIEGWVKTPDEIVLLLAVLKEKVTQCSQLYIERTRQASRQADGINAPVAAESGEQGRLNRIIAGLNFEGQANTGITGSGRHARSRIRSEDNLPNEPVELFGFIIQYYMLAPGYVFLTADAWIDVLNLSPGIEEELCLFLNRFRSEFWCSLLFIGRRFIFDGHVEISVQVGKSILPYLDNIFRLFHDIYRLRCRNRGRWL